MSKSKPSSPSSSSCSFGASHSVSSATLLSTTRSLLNRHESSSHITIVTPSPSPSAFALRLSNRFVIPCHRLLRRRQHNAEQLLRQRMPCILSLPVDSMNPLMVLRRYKDEIFRQQPHRWIFVCWIDMVDDTAGHAPSPRTFQLIKAPGTRTNGRAHPPPQGRIVEGSKLVRVAAAHGRRHAIAFLPVCNLTAASKAYRQSPASRLPTQKALGRSNHVDLSKGSLCRRYFPQHGPAERWQGNAAKRPSPVPGNCLLQGNFSAIIIAGFTGSVVQKK